MDRLRNAPLTKHKKSDFEQKLKSIYTINPLTHITL